MQRVVVALVLIAVTALTLALAPRSWHAPTSSAVPAAAGYRQARPQGVMGTTCRLVVDGGDEAAALADAEQALRTAEMHLSVWIDQSALGRLNRADAEASVRVGTAVSTVARRAHRAWRATGGAFDATCAPLIALWRQAGRGGAVPDAQQVAAARAASSWDDFTIGIETIGKRRATARLDLGGIAKGWAIDRAIAAMRARGARAGLVDVGGDLRLFGPAPDGDGWPVRISAPDGQGICAELRLAGGAVATSGNYHRFTTIAGRRYSHILDPRSGRPADAVPAVTVVAADAVTADIWATALSVLGPAGLASLPEGVEALLIGGVTADAPVHMSDGFADILVRGPVLPHLPDPVP